MKNIVDMIVDENGDIVSQNVEQMGEETHQPCGRAK